MDIDFSALDNLRNTGNNRPNKEAAGPGEYKTLPGAETARNEPFCEPQAHIQLDRVKKERQAISDTYATQQEAIRRSGGLPAEILKGMQEGKDIAALFLLAMECIGSMTGDNVLYSKARADMESIYGLALGEPFPLRSQLEETEARLSLLQEALDRERQEADRTRIQAAITAHKERISRLQGIA